VPYGAGTSVAFRDIRHGVVYWAWPGRVVEDGNRGLLVAQRPRALGRVPAGYPLDRQRVFDLLESREPPEIVEAAWERTTTLTVYRDDAWWGSRLFWDATRGAFLGYYVDLLEPLGRHGRCIDLVDLALDLVVAPDGEWHWKDVDEYETFKDAGIIGSEAAAMVESIKPELVRAVESKAFPFDDSLVGWRWPRDYPIPGLPEDWAHVAP
jgi:hypothetical protein